MLISDDDSEPILGQWFEETLSPTEPQNVDVPPPVTAVSDADSKHAQHRGSADSICMSADKKEPDNVCDSHNNLTALYKSVYYYYY